MIIFFFNSLEHFTISGNIIYDISDHLPNFLIFDKFSSLPNNIKLYSRDYSRFTPQDLLSDFQLINWQTVLSSEEDPSAMFCSFYNKISTIIDKHIPVKQLSKNERKLLSKPRITPALRKSIYVKNNLHKKFIKTKSIYIHTKFKLYRNKLNHLLKISKRKYYNNYFLDNIRDWSCQQYVVPQQQFSLLVKKSQTLKANCSQNFVLSSMFTADKSFFRNPEIIIKCYH